MTAAPAHLVEAARALLGQRAVRERHARRDRARHPAAHERLEQRARALPLHLRVPHAGVRDHQRLLLEGVAADDAAHEEGAHRHPAAVHRHGDDLDARAVGCRGQAGVQPDEPELDAVVPTRARHLPARAALPRAAVGLPCCGRCCSRSWSATSATSTARSRCRGRSASFPSSCSAGRRDSGAWSSGSSTSVARIWAVRAGAVAVFATWLVVVVVGIEEWRAIDLRYWFFYDDSYRGLGGRRGGPASCASASSCSQHC